MPINYSILKHRGGCLILEEIVMNNLAQFEASFHEYMQDLSKWVPDGIVNIDLETLNSLNLLSATEFTDEKVNDLTFQFHVIEANDKVTLFNDKFVVWVVPNKRGETSTTFTLIAINNATKPKLEIAFSTSGVYNTSRFVLNILEHFLKEIDENEDTLSKIGQLEK